MIDYTTMIKGFKCKRCGHEWKPKVKNPVQCPKCRSPYWDRERIKK
jgi:predicted Zn-ribbon and HTH transcriptional regulator